MNRKHILAIAWGFMFFLSLGNLFAQKEQFGHDPNGAFLSQLEPLVRSQFGDRMRLRYYFVLDSLINKGPIEGRFENVTDPYGTLQHCVLFSARPPLPRIRPENEHVLDDSTIFGIFKNGTILWSTGPVCKGYFLDLFSSSDLNNDGKVDIAMINHWHVSGRNSERMSFLWIFSWDGNTGHIINQADSLGYSALKAADEMFELLDFDGDGVKEIRGEWLTEDDPDGGGYFTNNPSPTRPWVTYGWNGSLYGYWPSIHQVGGHDFLPANRLSASVSCKITIADSLLDYAYTWTNSPSSKQDVSAIYLGGVKMLISSRGPTNWLMQSTILVNGRIWDAFFDNKPNMIKPGQISGGFGLTSSGLPALIKAFAQGYSPKPRLLNETGAIVISEEMARNDILTNSVQVFTVGPVDPPSPFDPLNFLDTLKSWTTQSRSFGWITTQPIVDKYFGYFNTARTQLQGNNGASTKTTLQHILQDVNVDSSSALTSEAYALIRYNTEYLLKKLNGK
ncbi:MAG: VCBS repeat-containing protein [Ignavibacteriales bacterium]|nr:VCBS repeat-containing protein [Ignavibacteriales bacterium]